MERYHKFLVVLLLSFSGEIFSQNREFVHHNEQFLKQFFVDRPRVVNGSFSPAREQQTVVGFEGMNSQVVRKAPTSMFQRSFFNPSEEAPFTGFNLGHLTLNTQRTALVTNVNAASYISGLGFFCKKELQLDQLTPMPVRFRLGSMEYVNYMEQKPNAVRY